MGFGSSYRTKSRRLAFLFLIIFGAAVIILGLLVLGIGLAITHNDRFSESLGIREQIESTIDYVQYWIGLPYVFAGLSVACSAVNLRKVVLTVCTIVVSLICVVLSLAGLVVDGPDFVWWKDLRAYQRYWEGQDGFSCSSNGDTCECKNGANTPLMVTGITDCETLMILSSLYGLLTGCFIVVLVILLASVFVIVYIVTSKREQSKRGGTTYYHTSDDLAETARPETVLEHPVREVTNPAQGHEYPIGPAPVPEPPRLPPAKPIPYKDHKSGVSDSVSQQNNDDVSTVVENEGIVMMDPGRFRLGDDDIY